MGAEDFMLDGCNMFLNPSLMGSQQQFFGGRFNYEDILSIHTDRSAPTYNDAMNGTLFGAPEVNGLEVWNAYNNPYVYNQRQNPQQNFMFNSGVPTSHSQNMFGNSFVGQQPQQQQSFNMMFDGGVAYRNSNYTNGASLLNFSGMNVGSSEELYIGGAYIPSDIKKESKGYSYSISTNGTVRFVGPGRKIMTLDEFKTALGDDFDKFKEVINKDCKERGFNEPIS